MVNMPRSAFRFRTVARLCRAAAASGFLLVIVFSGTGRLFGEPGVECLHLMAQCDSGEGKQSWLTCCLYCFRRCIIPEYTINIAEQREANRCHYEQHNAGDYATEQRCSAEAAFHQIFKAQAGINSCKYLVSVMLLFINQDGFFCYGCPWRQRLYESVDYFVLPALTGHPVEGRQ